MAGKTSAVALTLSLAWITVTGAVYTRSHSLNCTGWMLSVTQHGSNLCYIDCQISIVRWSEHQCCGADKCHKQMKKHFTKRRKQNYERNSYGSALSTICRIHCSHYEVLLTIIFTSVELYLWRALFALLHHHGHSLIDMVEESNIFVCSLGFS